MKAREHSSIERTHTEAPVRALIVDDEQSLAELLSMALRYEGWETRTALSAAQAFEQLREFTPDVVVLDVMLPGLDGVEILRRVRSANNQVPVLFLTARDALQDRLTGLAAGGDDYVTKPFSLDEIVARLRALVRRSTRRRQSSSSSILSVGELAIDCDSYEVTRAGTPIELTSTEFELLRLLLESAPRVLNKQEIYEHVWGGVLDDRSNIVEVYISYLRRKIDAGRVPMIHTLRGFGYVVKQAADA